MQTQTSLPYDTVTIIEIYSRRMKNIYQIHRFSEYMVDIDLDIDADQFNMVLEDARGAYTGVFGKFDPIDIFINGTPVLHGMLDEVEYITDDGSRQIRVMGRDMIWVLVDNDAIPNTLYNVNPAKYIKQKCADYGIYNTNIKSEASTVEKLIIGCGESEISIMSNLLVEDYERVWTLYDRLYVGKWNTSGDPIATLSRGVKGNGHIPIKRLSFRDSSQNMRSEYIIYGSANDGKEKVVGKSSNKYLIDQGIKKRRVIRSSNNDASSKYSSNALRHIRDDFQNDMVLKIDVKADHIAGILPNSCIRVVDDMYTGIDGVFFIRAMTFSKNINGGSVVTLTCIPSEQTFDVVWSNQGDKYKGNLVGVGKK